MTVRYFSSKSDNDPNKDKDKDQAKQDNDDGKKPDDGMVTNICNYHASVFISTNYISRICAPLEGFIKCVVLPLCSVNVADRV